MAEIKMVECEVDSPLYSHAKRELELVGPVYSGMVNDAALTLVGVFAAQGHSGGSAKLTAEIVGKLMRYEPLTSLTGKDDEWIQISEGEYQNKRCSHVFKCSDGAYDIDTPRIESGIGNGPWAKIEFPYTPQED